MVFAGVASTGWADDPVKKDAEFGGQILTLTQPKPEVGPSTNPRYQEQGDGTVLDLEAGVVWTQQDSYQRTKDWINWHDAQTYLRKLNESNFGGSNRWRLPTKKELSTLFDENSSIPWNYYWTENEVHMDPVFGSSHCCYWTAEEYKEEMAWGFNFIRGKPYVSMKGGIQKSLTAVRPVRDLTDEEKKKAQELRAALPKASPAP